MLKILCTVIDDCELDGIVLQKDQQFAGVPTPDGVAFDAGVLTGRAIVAPFDLFRETVLNPPAFDKTGAWDRSKDDEAITKKKKQKP